MQSGPGFFPFSSSLMDCLVLPLLFRVTQWGNYHGLFGQSPKLQPVSETWSVHKGARAQRVKDVLPGADIGHGECHDEDQYPGTE